MKATHKAFCNVAWGELDMGGVCIVDQINGNDIVQLVRGGKLVGPTFCADRLELLV